MKMIRIEVTWKTEHVVHVEDGDLDEFLQCQPVDDVRDLMTFEETAALTTKGATAVTATYKGMA